MLSAAGRLRVLGVCALGVWAAGRLGGRAAGAPGGWAAGPRVPRAAGLARGDTVIVMLAAA
ncbi:MAG TPA: hypothetical protein VMV92_14655 [Streptosporangiaceae bacterium]|nr:hypothetical protein [Streptosporangiaceae bacterium]